MDEPESRNDYDAEKDDLKNAEEGVRKAAQAPKKAVRTVKNTVSIAKQIAQAIGTAASALGPLGIAIVSVLLAVLIVINSLAGYQRQLVDENDRLTPAGQTILSYFDLVVNNGLFDDTESERSNYQSLLSEIKSEGYSDELCGIFQVMIKETAFEGVSYSYDGGDAQAYATNNNESATTFVTREYLAYYNDGSYDNPSDDFHIPERYDGLTSCRKVNREFDFDKLTSDYESNGKGAYFRFHYYYTNNLFKFCIDAFCDDTGKLIESVDSLSQKRAREQNISTDGESTEYNRLKEQVNKEQVENIYEKMCDNLNNSEKYKCHFSLVQNDNEEPRYVNLNLRNYIREDRNTPLHLTGQSSDEYCSRIKNASRGFLISNASAQQIVQLALSQEGNNHEIYTQEMNNGVCVDWCAIFCGWLLKHCNIDLSNVGYSMSVPTWASEADSRGMYRDASTYTPREGDFIFFGNGAGISNLYHMGIVAAVDTDTITTVEGNSGGQEAPYSKVVVHTYSLSYPDISGYLSMSYRTSYSGVTGGSVAFGDDEQGILDQYYSSSYDENYTPQAYDITADEREELARIVMGEFGTSRLGAYLIAQCLRDAVACGNVDRDDLIDIASHMGYDGYNSYPNQTSYDAVDYIFSGGCVVHHRILYMYATYITSSWHETLNFIIEVPVGRSHSVRFFDKW